MDLLTQLIAIILPTSALFIGIYQFFKAEKFRRQSQFSKEAIDNAFTPLEPLFEKIIFRTITEQNIDELKNRLKYLLISIHEKKLQTYLHEDLLIELDFILKYMQKKDYKQANAYLYTTSRRYWKLYNQYRQSIGMPKRSLKYRIHKKMYTSRDLFFYHFKGVLYGFVQPIVQWALLIYTLVILAFVFILI